MRLVRYRVHVAMVAVIAALTIVACGRGTPAGQTVAAPAPPISVEGAWARAAVQDANAGGGMSAVYMVVHNRSDEDDTLIGVHSDAANAAEVHRTAMENGVMQMQPAGGVAVPAKGQVTLEPGGLHVMLMGLRQDLREGSAVTVTMQFERAVPVQVPVRRI